jgi:hypothetical protein
MIDWNSQLAKGHNGVPPYRVFKYTVQPPPAKGERLSQAAYRRHVDNAFWHVDGGWLNDRNMGINGVKATRRYRLEWEARSAGENSRLREMPEDWTGKYIKFSDGLKVIEPGAVHSLGVFEKHYQFRELVAIIEIQF